MPLRTTQAFKYFCRVSHLSLHVRRRLYIWVVLAGLVSSPAADGDDDDDGDDGDDVEEEADVVMLVMIRGCS